MCCRVLVVNVTATTGIYTYRHPLSLLDALPIKPPIESPGASEKGPSGGTGAAHSGVRRLNGPGSMDRRGDADLAVADELPGQVRSEEPTSELQSLMRISYAVFCLKKKK